MTNSKDFKKAVRARMADTGETYLKARMSLLIPSSKNSHRENPSNKTHIKQHFFADRVSKNKFTDVVNSLIELILLFGETKSKPTLFTHKKSLLKHLTHSLDKAGIETPFTIPPELILNYDLLNDDEDDSDVAAILFDQPLTIFLFTWLQSYNEHYDYYRTLYNTFSVDDILHHPDDSHPLDILGQQLLPLALFKQIDIEATQQLLPGLSDYRDLVDSSIRSTINEIKRDARNLPTHPAIDPSILINGTMDDVTKASKMLHIVRSLGVQTQAKMVDAISNYLDGNPTDPETLTQLNSLYSDTALYPETVAILNKLK